MGIVVRYGGRGKDKWNEAGPRFEKKKQLSGDQMLPAALSSLFSRAVGCDVSEDDYTKTG